MRILGVRFKNLNSLAGEWQVDFTHPAYASDGIFAITGPTGAGKTTIMDAVCLALYGSTPRLGKVTKGGNEIMSRQTGECFAEVTFETAKGRYCCHWSQRRAHKKPDGELQQSRHEIADAESGRVLESKINQVGVFIEKVTGMDFGRFTRSMLLAQGGFAAFLQASPNERSPILEQITGTEIYSQISIQVHERRVAEQEKLDLMQAELKGIRILGEEEERELQNRLKEKQVLEADLAGKLKEMTGALAWIAGMAALAKELGELEKQRQAFEERRQVFAPEAQKLEKARKALGLEGDYRSVMVVRELQAREAKELQDALAILPEKEKAGAAALAARSAADGLLNEARDRQAKEGEIIKRVRDLDVRLDEQRKQLTEKTNAILEIEKQAKTYSDSIGSNEQELKKVHAALKTLEEYRTRHAADAVLATQFGVIERGFAGLDIVQTKYSNALKELSRAAGKKESALAARVAKEADHEKARLAFEKKQTALKDLADAITVLLRGRDIGQWREDLDAFKERERLLVQIGETVSRMDRATTALDALKATLEQSIARHAAILNEIKSCGDQKILLEKEIAALEIQVSLLSRIRDLEAERKRLEDGRPCPLCGATEHPYAKGNLPVLNQAESDLKERKEGLKAVSQRLSELEAGRVKTAADIQHAEKETAEKKAALDADQEQCIAMLSKLNLEASPTERSGRIRGEIEAVLAKIAETAKMVALVEEKGRQEKSAQAALEEARKTLDNAGKALQEARHNLETAGLDHERLTKECAGLTAESEKARAAVLEDVKPLGVSEIPPDGFSDLLKDLTRRKDSWQAKEAEKTALEKKAGELKAAVETHQALLDKLEEDVALRYKDRDGMKGEHETLGASRRTLFGEKNADGEEKRLSNLVDQANAKREKAREDYGLIEKEIGTLKERIGSLQERTAQRAAELNQTEQHVLARIQGAGFADEADYLSARLTEEERASLAEREQSLLKEKTEMEARRKDKADTLAHERAKRLTDQSAEALAEKVAAGDAELKKLGLDIGGIHQILSDNERQKGSQRERLKAIDVQKMEWSRWDELHSLIGSADGKKFRNFAQGLTFEMMTYHANRRLREMTDRYLLIRDAEQPLELNVIDNYQAGEIRSTKNLSGGESFIVSLALALGLSQMASRNVRVDSLFLDEGFGTLDEDALETALETLAGLRQDGKLIGVISHVAALKERIGTQIQVAPESGGRSSLSGPGCRRIRADNAIGG
ncbi:MAG: AAA family ATPase [Deltaproteobacteria bacterium]|nr:AAA family ATPase [Deltaproteobacteria bacterium]